MPRIHTGAVLRLANAALRRHENARVPEKARRERRDGDKAGLVPHERNAIRGERHFRRVELAVAQHPEKRLLNEELVIDEVDTLGAHASIRERTGPVVIPAGEGELESGHRISHPLLGKEGWRGAPGWFDNLNPPPRPLRGHPSSVRGEISFFT